MNPSLWPKPFTCSICGVVSNANVHCVQMDIEDRAHGFEIQRDGAEFVLVDRDTFNNWGKLKQRFPTRDAAEEYARRCYEFKCGRRAPSATEI